MTDTSTTVPASTTPAATTTPPAGANSTTPAADPVELARELGAAKEQLKELQSYKEKVDPVLETLYSDNELLQKATIVHNKRLGKTVETPPTTTQTPAPGTTTPTPARDNDSRMATVNILSNQFEEKVGINKLPAEEQSKVRGMVGQMLKEMLDPNGNKTITQVFEEVSLTKLPWFLERAYDLVSKSDQIARAREEGKNEVIQQYEGNRGVMGSMPGGSVPIDQVTLSQAEKSAAAKMGVSEEDYLKNKKEVLTLRNS